MIARSNLTAPRVSPEDLDAEIAHTEIVRHVTHSGQVLRWAILTTRNGFAVTGRPSASVNPENDRAEIGEKVAIENARAELWPLLGFRLRDQLEAARTARDDLVVAFPVSLFPASIATLDSSEDVARKAIPRSPDFPKDWTLEEVRNDNGGHIVVRFTTPPGSPSLPASWQSVSGLRVIGRGPLDSFKRRA